MAQKSLTLTTTGAFALTLAISGIVQAQANKELVLEEVLVTAQKQTQNLTKTPVAVNAISSEDFNSMASFDLADIDRMTAGVDISGDAFNIDFKVRGTGTNLDAGTPPRVTLYKDGAFTNQQRAIFLAQFDLKRFELLRGPQGTLYGKASPAGSLVIHTADPSLNKRDGYVQLSAFDRNGSNTQFGVSQPIIEDKLGIRIAGVFDKNSNSDTELRNLGNDDVISRTSAGRATVKWLINQKLDMRVSYNYTENSSDFQNTTAPGTTKPEDRASFDDTAGYLSIRDQHAIGEMNYAITDDIILTGVSLYQELYTERFFDADTGAANPSTGNVVQTQFVQSNISKALNSEIRLHNTTSDTWKWITGFYYSRSTAHTPVRDFTQTSFGTVDFRLTATNSQEDFGLFHHSTIQMTEENILTLGVRFNDSRINARSPFNAVGTGFLAGNSGSGESIPLENEKRRFQEWTGTIKFQRDFNDITSGYLSWDKGWRPASSTVDATGNVPDQLILHDDESSTNFELGLKGKFWDGRAQYATAIFHQTYKDFQVQADGIFVDRDGDGDAFTGTDISMGGMPTGRPATFNAVVNAKEVVIQGIEGEVTVLLAPNWTGFLSVAHYDVEFNDYDDAPCNSGGSTNVSGGMDGFNTCDFSGQRATEAPNFSAIASSEYSLDLGDRGMEWYLRGLVKYEGSRYFRSVESNQPTEAVQDDYTIVDVFTGVRDNRGRWDVNVWVKNATDENVIETFEVNTSSTVLNVNDPLTAGITGTWRFGLDD